MVQLLLDCRPDPIRYCTVSMEPGVVLLRALPAEHQTESGGAPLWSLWLSSVEGDELAAVAPAGSSGLRFSATAHIGAR